MASNQANPQNDTQPQVQYDPNQPVQILRGEYDQLVSTINALTQEQQQARAYRDDLRALIDAMRQQSLDRNAERPPQRDPPPTRFSLKVDLPTFKGLQDEDVSAWISLIEDQLDAQSVPPHARTAAVSALLRNEAQTWYLQLKKNNNDQPPSWVAFKTALKNKYDSPFKYDELRLKLERLKYRDMDDYLRKFQSLVSQLPDTEMTFADKRMYFLKNLPSDIQHRIRYDRPDTLDKLYSSARDWARVDRMNGKKSNSPSSSSRNDNRRSRENNLPTTNAGSTVATDAMDLDAIHAVEMAAVRCYICQKNGHFSYDCPDAEKDNVEPSRPSRASAARGGSTRI